MAGPVPFGNRLTPLFAVVTLPLGILAFLFSGWLAAAVVFLVGWLLLVPATAVLFGPSWAAETAAFAEFQAAGSRLDGESGAEETNQSDPVDELRDRYARGEIDEGEFERRLEGLLETEDVDAADQETVERAVERLSDGEGLDSTEDEAGRDAELERESE